MVKVKKEIVNSQLINVPKHLYNTLRSFVESSSKKDYPWNTGVRLNDSVIFEKTGKWRLTIYTDLERSGGTIAVLTSRNNTVFVVSELRDGRRVIELPAINVQVNLANDVELRRTMLIADVPFAVPISLAEVVNKLYEYVEF